MPKATIQWPTVDKSEPAEVALHWSKEQSHVQLSIERFPFGVVQFENAKGPDGEPILESAAIPHDVDESDAGLTSTTVYSDPMTRNEINELIRALRRARDAAFGADA